MKNKAAQALGKLGKGKSKTMTPAAIAARRAQMAKINAAKRSKTEQMIRDAWLDGYRECSVESGGVGNPESLEHVLKASDDYLRSAMQKNKKSSSKKSTNQ